MHENGKDMKTALISGGTSGIGISIARDLLQKGYKVYLIGSNGTKGKSIETSLSMKYPGQVEFIQLDLSMVRDTQIFATDFSKKTTKLDLLVNTAGIMAPKRIITSEGFEKTFAVGYLSAFILSTELAPLLEQADHGRIANVAGVKSFILNAKLDFDDLTFSKNYGTIKAAITTIHAKTVLTEILAAKYASKGIDVISFHPGAVKSTLMRNMEWWKRLPFAVANFFMSKESKTGIYVSSSPEINGVSGKYFEKTKPIVLNFDREYKQKLWEHTEKLLDTV